VIALSKAYFCSRSPVEIVGPRPAGGMEVCLLSVLCVVTYRSVRRAGHLSRAFLPSVARRRVRSKNPKNEEVMPRVGPQRHRKKKIRSKFSIK